MLSRKMKKRLDALLGARIKQQALLDFERGRSGRRDFLGYLALIISIFVIVSPLVIAVLGLMIMRIDFPNLFTLATGFIFIWVGWFLRPRVAKNTAPTFRRNDFPNLFELLDNIAKEMGARPVDGVHLLDDFNAYLTTYGKGGSGETIVGIGIPLWMSLDTSQKVAVLAHEIAHSMNGDIARTVPASRAMYMLGGWQFLVSPTHIVDHENSVMFRTDDDGIVAGMFSGSMQFLFGLVQKILGRLMYADSQKSEYLADGIGAKVSGVPAGRSVLKVLALTPLLDRTIGGMYVTKNKPESLYREMANAILQATPQDRAAMLAEMETENQTVDATHPPTRLRLEFLRDLPDLQEPLKVDAALFAAIDLELAAEIEKMDQNFRMHWIVQ